MLIKAKTIKNYKLHGLDGEIGKVKEFYFDDKHWTVRYLVADTGNWFTGRKVLISPYAIGAVNAQEESININLTKKQIEDSPLISSDEPVSHQFEEDYYNYYEFPIYWGGTEAWGPCGLYPSIEDIQEKSKESTERAKEWDSHLRSTHSVAGYNIQATDGEIGHVDDFIIDDKTLAIRYLVIDTRNWWPGKKILISSKWIKSVSWEESKVFVNLLCETIKKSPEYTEETVLTRDYENELHQHYNKQGYWVDEENSKKK